MFIKPNNTLHHWAAKSIQRTFWAICIGSTGWRMGHCADTTTTVCKIAAISPRRSLKQLTEFFWKCLLPACAGVGDSGWGQCHMRTCQSHREQEPRLKPRDRGEVSQSEPEARWKWHNEHQTLVAKMELCRGPNSKCSLDLLLQYVAGLGAGA